MLDQNRFFKGNAQGLVLTSNSSSQACKWLQRADFDENFSFGKHYWYDLSQLRRDSVDLQGETSIYMSSAAVQVQWTCAQLPSRTQKAGRRLASCSGGGGKEKSCWT